MNDFDPLALLDQQVGFSPMGGSSREIMHRREQENLDEIALAVLDKKVPMKTAAKLARQGLIKPPPNMNKVLRQQQFPQPMQDQFYDPMEIKQNDNETNTLIENLNSKIEFLTRQLELCESYLPEDKRKEYKIDWMMKVMEAAGDDFMAAAGKGFLKTKEQPEGNTNEQE